MPQLPIPFVAIPGEDYFGKVPRWLNPLDERNSRNLKFQERLINEGFVGPFSPEFIQDRRLEFIEQDAKLRREASKDFRINDPRKIRATTGQPMRPGSDYVSGNYNSEVMKNIIGYAKKHNIDPYTALAIGLAETNFGTSDPNIGHVLHSGPGVAKDTPPEEELVLTFLDKLNYAKRLGKKTPESIIQAYQGYGKIHPTTEQDYHGFKMKSIFGVPIPPGGLDMSQTNLYGKNILDLRDNVLKQNPSVVDLVNTTEKIPLEFPLPTSKKSGSSPPPKLEIVDNTEFGQGGWVYPANTAYPARPKLEKGELVGRGINYYSISNRPDKYSYAEGAGPGVIGDPGLERGYGVQGVRGPLSFLNPYGQAGVGALYDAIRNPNSYFGAQISGGISPRFERHTTDYRRVPVKSRDFTIEQSDEPETTVKKYTKQNYWSLNPNVSAGIIGSTDAGIGQSSGTVDLNNSNFSVIPYVSPKVNLDYNFYRDGEPRYVGLTGKGSYSPGYKPQYEIGATYGGNFLSQDADFEMRAGIRTDMRPEELSGMQYTPYFGATAKYYIGGKSPEKKRLMSTRYKQEQGGYTQKGKKIRKYGPRPDYMNQNPNGMTTGPITQRSIGNTPGGGYMSFGEGGNTAYEAWYKHNTPEGRQGLPDSYSDYDYQRYYNDAVRGLNPMDFDEESQHFPDTYKYPWHPSFSDESIYYINQKETPALSYNTKADWKEYLRSKKADGGPVWEIIDDRPMYAEGGSTGLNNMPVYKVWESVTNTPWNQAKASNLTTGTAESNLALKKRLLAGEFNDYAPAPAPTNFPSPVQLDAAAQASAPKDFNEAFKIARERLGPNQIFEYQGRKYGTNLAGEKFNPSQDTLTAAGLNTPKTKSRLEQQNKMVGSVYSDKVTVKLEPEYQEWEKVKKRQDEINKMDQAEIIRNYHKGSNDQYLILDKSKGKIHLYQGDKAIASYNVGTGMNVGDEQTYTVVKDNKVLWEKGNRMTGAGVYTVAGASAADPHYSNAPTWNFKNEKGISVPMAMHSSFGDRTAKIRDTDPANNRLSNGCINGLCYDLKQLYKQGYNEGDKLYVLPDDPNNKFQISNGKLIFKSENPKVNKTEATLNYKPIKVNFNEKSFMQNVFQSYDLDDENELYGTTLPFIKSLESNKQKVMKAAKINGDVYNELAKMAFGIYGTESNFGDTHTPIVNAAKAANKLVSKSLKYLGVNYDASSPDYKSKYTTYSRDAGSESVGLTQLKWSQLNTTEKKALSELGITSNKDFLDPEKAAMGTVAVLATRYNEQLTGEQKKDLWKNLPAKWNSRGNYPTRVWNNSRYINILQEDANSGKGASKTVTVPKTNYRTTSTWQLID